MRIGVKYCGGCRTEYDRKETAEEAEALVRATAPTGRQKEVSFVPVQEDGSYDALLVICGCKSKCADLSRYNVNGKTVYLDHPKDMEDAVRELLGESE